jgi:hypothetical protein
MGRSLLGVLAGAVVAVVMIMIVESIGMFLYPLPAGVDPTDSAALAAAVPSLPLGAFLFVLASWVLGAGAGALVALRVARGPARWPGLAVGCLVLLGAAYNIMVIPHPTWFVGAAAVGIVAATLLATARRGRATGSPA